ncbi:MAG TPA: lysophospholipid acyltransferase family protein [Chthonomonadaceae bacterium]|nr:lysophospholipid acyltransferase family protein [Chthonomonadaceae bacterium]
MEPIESAASLDSAPIDASIDPANGSEQEHRRLLRRSRLIGGLVYGVARAVYKTVRLDLENIEHAAPTERGAILVTWHGRTLIPANVFMRRGYWALISLSRDGEIQNNIFSRLGYRTIRGSTGRGGIRGALQMARKVKEGGVLTFTPDGPRGPTHKVQPGVILMAEKSGAPIVPIGVSADRRWLAKSWDSYMIPKPFAHAFMLIGEPIYCPAKSTESTRVEMCERLELAINRLEREAELRAGHSCYPSEYRTE